MFRLRVLGGFALEGPPGSPAPQRPQRRGDAVLAVLAVCGDRGCTRERLVALLWPESDEARSRQGLRDALYAIRRALEPGAVPSDGRLLRLDPAVVTSDAQAFAQALACGRHADAVHAYTGPLLDGFHVDDAPEFERWLDGERVRLARQNAEALEHLAMAAEAAGDWHEALGWWGRAVEHDPLNSHFVLQQVRSMAAIGDRANALKAVEAHARRLRDELGLEPDRDFLADVERIRRGELPARRGGAPRRAPSTAAGGEAPVAVIGEARSTPVGAAGVARRRRWLPWAAGVAAAGVLAGAYLSARRVPPAPHRSRPRTAIAVLPFQSLGADSAHAFFAGGLHDELLSQLAKVASLRIVGRTSLIGYGETPKPLRQIAEELDVGSIVEGSVQVVGDRLRVVVQLLDPGSETELWVERYDRGLDSLLTVQSEIARQIVAAVGATLTSAEAGAIAAAPTANPQAYELYLQGLEYFRRPGLLRSNLEAAQQLLERAVALDSAFAPAHAEMAQVHFAIYGPGHDPSPERLDRARREVAMALRLAPELPQAHLVAAEALLRYHPDPRGALRELGLGLRGAPNDADLWSRVAIAYRALGMRDSALAAFQRAVRLDPRNANLYHMIGDSYHHFHRFPEAIAAYRHENLLAPDVVQARLSLAWSYVLWKGDLDTLQAVLRDLPEDADPGMGGGGVGQDRLFLLWLERRPDSLESVLRRLPWATRTEPEATLNRALWEARIHMLRGDTVAARATNDTARAILKARARAHPDDAGVRSTLGIVLAALGRRGEALREARWFAHTEAYRNDADASAVQAELLAMAGETDAALTDLERALVGPSTVTVPLLRLSPIWDGIRRDPRFEALLARYADPETP